MQISLTLAQRIFTASRTCGWYVCAFGVGACLTPPLERINDQVSSIYISAYPLIPRPLYVSADTVALHPQDGPFTMKLFKDCWFALLDVFSALTGTPTDGTQKSLGFGHSPGHGHVPKYPFPPKHKKPSPPTPSRIPLPIFAPPSHGESPDSSILCDYTAMGPGWGNCSSPEDRGCWLKGPNGQKFTIDTDYETQYPKGVTRKVYSSNSQCGCGLTCCSTFWKLRAWPSMPTEFPIHGAKCSTKHILVLGFVCLLSGTHVIC